MNGLGVTITSADVKEIIQELHDCGSDNEPLFEKLETLGLELQRACNILPPGLYKHYKGGRYYIHHIGRDSEDMTMTVSYQSMDTGEIWFRPFHMFLEHVEIDQKDIGTRFTRVTADV